MPPSPPSAGPLPEPVCFPAHQPSFELNPPEASAPWVLSLMPGVPFERLREHVKEGLAPHAAVLAGQSVRLDVRRRELDLFDLRRLSHLLKDALGLEVVGVMATPESLQRYAEKELKLKIQVSSLAPSPAPAPPTPAPLPPVEAEEAKTVVLAAAPAAGLAAAPAPEPETVVAAAPALEEITASERPAEKTAEKIERAAERAAERMVYKGTLRAGQRVEAPHDLYVFGDVNAGAELVAGGSVVVMGALKGVVYAATRADGFVLALDFRPTQLRLGGQIHMPTAAAALANRPYLPEIAYLSGGSIQIEPYRGRLPAFKEST